MNGRSPNKQPRRGPMRGHGPMGRGIMMKGEKARDFKGTMLKLLRYLAAYKLSVTVVIIFAIASTAFSIVGPKILGQATTKLFPLPQGYLRKNQPHAAQILRRHQPGRGALPHH
ncbi:MAG: hypothetical protein P8Y03_24050 [Anaerolineales bacterium]